jgi:hypothetical protein
VDLMMSLWGEEGIYLLPNQSVLKGKAAIRPMAEKLLGAFKSGGGATSAFNFTFQCDAATVEQPTLVTVVGEQSLVIGGQRHSAQVMGWLTKADGTWKVSTVGVVQATQQLLQQLDLAK